MFSDGSTMSTSPFITNQLALDQAFGAGQTSKSTTRNKTYMRRYAYHRSDAGGTTGGAWYFSNGDSGYQSLAGDHSTSSIAEADQYSTYYYDGVVNRAYVYEYAKTTGLASRAMALRATGVFGQNTDDGLITRISILRGSAVLAYSDNSWGGAVWQTNGDVVANFVSRTHTFDFVLTGADLQAGVTIEFAARITGGSGQAESAGIKTTAFQFLNWV